jgi:hypothetical protein
MPSHDGGFVMGVVLRQNQGWVNRGLLECPERRNPSTLFPDES